MASGRISWVAILCWMAGVGCTVQRGGHRSSARGERDGGCEACVRSDGGPDVPEGGTRSTSGCTAYGPLRLLHVFDEEAFRHPAARLDEVVVRDGRLELDRGTGTAFTTQGTFRSRVIELGAAARIERVQWVLDAPPGIRRGSSGAERVYQNGEVLLETHRGGDLSSWDPDYRLGLGNEIEGDRGWRGRFYRVAIYDRALSEAQIEAHFEAGPG